MGRRGLESRISLILTYAPATGTICIDIREASGILKLTNARRGRGKISRWRRRSSETQLRRDQGLSR